MSGERIAAGAGGRVIEVNFREGDEVKEGDVLVRLDTERLDNEIARHDFRSQGARDELDRLVKAGVAMDAEEAAAIAKAEVEIAEAEQAVTVERDRLRVEEERHLAALRVAETDVRLKKAELQRKTELVRLDLLPRIEQTRAAETLQESEARLGQARPEPLRSGVRQAEGRVELARRHAELVRKTYAQRRQEAEPRLARLRGELEAERKSLDNLKLERAQSVIKAHVDGIVTQGEVRVGDLLEAGRPVVAIAQQKGLRVDAAVTSSEIGQVRVGMPARVKLDSFDYQRYGTLPATVAFVSPDSQRLEGVREMIYVVRLTLDQTQLREGARARLGMTGVAEIVTGRERLLWLLLRDLKRAVDPRGDK